MVNGLLISFNLSSDINKLLLMHLDKLEVLPGDIVIVLFHLLEGLLMVTHQVIYVLVLSLLDLVNLDFESEL
jgi:hypothetical protein